MSMNPCASALLTDLYQLTMLHGYRVHAMDEVAVFELFMRKLPRQRNFLVAAGLEQALDYMENLRFTAEELAWIDESGLFPHGLTQQLETWRFTGDVDAMPEGTVFFGDEPIVRVVAPLPQAQLVESRLMNIVQFETMIASKAARSVLVAPGKLLVEFGLRRAHGAEAALLAARASYVAGFAGTSNVLDAARFGIPIFGTMAHSFVQAHDDEATAFEHFAIACPGNITLLIDTYDTEEGARKVVKLAAKLKSMDIRIKGVRLDSGDLEALAKSVRRILDDGGLHNVTIFASGNLDEYRVSELLAAKAPIDGFGIGTSLVTSADAPSLDAVYKLQEYHGTPRRKRSTGKATWPGRKQVFRHYDGAGHFHHDVISVEHDPQVGEVLLVPVMRGGKRVQPPESLATLRNRTAQQLAKLPPRLKTLEVAADPYRVEVSAALHKLASMVNHATSEVPALCK
jgi:nicotinate phosphoribosyltransferase